MLWKLQTQEKGTHQKSQSWDSVVRRVLESTHRWRTCQYVVISAGVFSSFFPVTDPNKGIFWVCEPITGTRTSPDLLPIIKSILPEHFPTLNFLPAKPPTPVVPIVTLLCSLLLCSSPYSWNPAFIFYCGVAHPANPAPLQPWGGDSFPPAPFLSPRSGGLSGLILQCCWSCPDLHTHTVCLSLPSLYRRERGRERKRQNISDRATADSEGEKKGSKHWWAERRRLSSFTHPSWRAPQHLLLFWNWGKTKGLRDVLERHSVNFTLFKASFPLAL